MNIRDYLKENVLLFDGAMGSYFSAIHEDPLYPCEHANITSPHTISEIHKRYLVAGAKAIKTNTFTLTYKETTPYSMEEIVSKGFQLAKKQADAFEAYTFADITTSTSFATEEDVYPWFQSIVDVFLREGATHFLFETCNSGMYINQLTAYIKSKVPDAFVLVSFAVNGEGYTKTGEFWQQLLEGLSNQVDATGFNCICGPHHMAKLMETVKSETTLSIMPNASYPTVMGNQLRFSQNPHYYADELEEVIGSVCQIVGGCCGTTPEFTAQLKKKIGSLSQETKVTPPPVVHSAEPVIKSDFFEKLKAGKKPVAVEWDTPALPNVTEYMAKAEQLKQAGVDMITIADNPVARSRLDSSLMACKLKRELGLHVMPHMTCRDRNINAVKSLLLGLSVEELNNVLIITGDPIPAELKNEVKTVYEFNSRKLIKHINQLNESLFHSPFYVYGALNINAVNFEVQLRMGQEKLDHGAVALFTQPVMSQRGYDNLKIAKERLNCPLVVGMYPAMSYRNINFLTNEISGFHVAPELIELYKDKTPEECAKLAVKVTSEIAREIAPFLDGFYLITPFQRVDVVLEILKTIDEIKETL